MDNLIGIRTDNFVLIASDMVVPSSIICVKSDENKFINIHDTVVLAHCGSFAQSCGLRRLFSENIKLMSLDNEVPLCSKTTASFIQQHIHGLLRKKQTETSFMVMDTYKSLYAIDQYGAMSTENYICMGYSRFFLYGLIDSAYNKNMAVNDALVLLQKCVDVMNEKFLIHYQNYTVKVFENGQLKSFNLKPTVK